MEIHRGSGASAAETTPLNTEREALAERVTVVQNVLPSRLLTTLPDKPAKWPACERKTHWHRRVAAQNRAFRARYPALSGQFASVRIRRYAGI